MAAEYSTLTGRPTVLHCYLCEPSPKKRLERDAGPRRLVVKEHTGGGSDPSAVYELSCGHRVI